MKTFLFSVFLLLFWACNLTIQAQETWQTLNIGDKERALVYEVFYKSGKIEYGETYTPPITYLTDIQTVGSKPTVEFWRTKPERGNRKFGAKSSATNFAKSTNLTSSSGNASAWIFRSAENSSPSAVIVGLRAAFAPAGNTGSSAPRQVTINLPARTVAYIATVFRNSKTPLYIDTNEQFLVSDGESGDFRQLARNETNAPITIIIKGWTTVDDPIGAKRHMNVSSKEAGSDVILLSGSFPSEPECFAAAVILKPLS